MWSYSTILRRDNSLHDRTAYILRCSIAWQGEERDCSLVVLYKLSLWEARLESFCYSIIVIAGDDNSGFWADVRHGPWEVALHFKIVCLGVDRVFQVECVTSGVWVRSTRDDFVWCSTSRNRCSWWIDVDNSLALDCAPAYDVSIGCRKLEVIHSNYCISNPQRNRSDECRVVRISSNRAETPDVKHIVKCTKTGVRARGWHFHGKVVCSVQSSVGWHYDLSWESILLHIQSRRQCAICWWNLPHDRWASYVEVRDILSNRETVWSCARVSSVLRCHCSDALSDSVARTTVHNCAYCRTCVPGHAASERGPDFELPGAWGDSVMQSEGCANLRGAVINNSWGRHSVCVVSFVLGDCAVS